MTAETNYQILTRATRPADEYTPVKWSFYAHGARYTLTDALRVVRSINDASDGRVARYIQIERPDARDTTDTDALLTALDVLPDALASLKDAFDLIPARHPHDPDYFRIERIRQMTIRISKALS